MPTQTNRAIACNYRTATRYAAEGAKAFLIAVNATTQRARVLVRSRGNRLIDRWERLDRLGSFRFVSPPVGVSVPLEWDGATVLNLMAEGG